jgi:hypothetical protein
MTSAGLPHIVHRSRVAFAAAVVLTLMVALIEVPTAAPPRVQGSVAAA